MIYSAAIQEEEGQEQLPSIAQAQTSDIAMTNQREEPGPPTLAPNRVDEPPNRVDKPSILVGPPTECQRSSCKSKPPYRLIESM